MQLELPHIILLFIVSVIVSTWLLRKYSRAKPYLLILSLLRLRGFTSFIRKQKRLSRFTTLISELGLVLGFGIFASDFLYGRKRKKTHRIIIAALTIICLFCIYNFSILRSFEISPIIKPYSVFLVLAFSVLGFSGLLLTVLGCTASNIVSKALAGEPSCPQVAPLVPGVQIPQMPFVIPVYAWIGIFLAVVIHEASHGIQALGEKLRIKSSGVLLLGIYPVGAFVEPDETDLKRARDITKLRVYSAGPSSNLLSMVPFLIIVMFLGSFFLVPATVEFEEAYVKGVDHVEVGAVSETLGFCGNPPAPAYGKLKEGMRLLEVNGEKIGSRVDVFGAIFERPFEESEFLVESDEKIERIFITPHPETNTFGFEVKNIMKSGFVFPQEKYNNYFYTMIVWDVFRWAFLISFLLAIINFLPLVLLDGWHIARILYPPCLKPFIKSKKKREKIVQNFFLFLVLLLFLLNALPLFF